MPLWECDDETWECIAMCLVECGYESVLCDISKLNINDKDKTDKTDKNVKIVKHKKILSD